MGFVSKRARHGRPVWCVHNEPTRLILWSKGKERCYRTEQQALDVWSVLDCHYTGRRCDKAPKGFVFPEPVGYTGPRRKVGVSKAEAERLLADLKRRGM